MNDQATSNRSVLLRFTNATFMAGVPALVLMFGLQTSQAGSATWKPHPTSGDWNNVANWRPRTIPNGSSDTATFGASDTTNVSLSAEETEVDGIAFAPGANAFTITGDYPNNLDFMGFGIANNSGLTQDFVTHGNGLSFHNQAAAGAQTVFTVSNYGSALGSIVFLDETSAAFGTFIIEGTEFFEDGANVLFFLQNSTAGNAVFINIGAKVGEDGGGGGTVFHDNSTAANGTITNKASAEGSLTGAETVFFDDSTAGDSVITNEGAGASGESGGGFTSFQDNTTAGNATVTCEGATAGSAGPGVLQFYGTSSAENATLIANGGSNGGDGGLIQFFDTSNGGTARVELYGNGTLDLTNFASSYGMDIGSLEGDGVVLLGANPLIIGTNDLSTTFSGVIEGSAVVTKYGSGTLTLTGANTYTGGTAIYDGFLKVSNRNGSATGSGLVSIYSGTMGGSGIVGGPIVVFTGGTLAPGTGALTLTVRNSVEFGGASHYAWRIRTTAATADKLIARRLIIDPGALFTGIAIGHATLPAGTTFTAIGNTSSHPISGTFSNLPDGGTITVGNNTFQANYEGGDGNDLTLTVVP